MMLLIEGCFFIRVILLMESMGSKNLACKKDNLHGSFIERVKNYLNFLSFKEGCVFSNFLWRILLS